MAILESIELSNIRRFASDVKIEIGRGATILLAPNGTGKTAVFEAIELALTGNVSRLGEDFVPLIKDGEKVASVKLNFTDWSREISVTEMGVVEIVPGQLDELFPGVDAQHYPYLLRLTHLLDQRGKQWFLQGNPEDAGQQLARLPLGREASQIFQKMVPIKRALTLEKTEASKQLEASSNKLAHWEVLISSRADSLSSVKPLTSFAEILTSIGSSQVGLTGAVAADLGYVREELGISSNAVNKKLAKSKNKLVELTEFLPQIKRYKELLGKSDHSKVLIEQGLNYLASLTQDINLLDQVISTNETLLVTISADHRKAIKKKEKTEMLGQERSKITGLEIFLEQLKVLRSSNNNLLIAKVKAYDELKSVIDKHSYVSSTLVHLSKQELRLLSSREALAQWIRASEELTKLSELISQIELAIAASDSHLGVFGSEVEVAELELSGAKAALDNLANLENKLKAALAQLSTCIDPGSDECPVCKSHVGASHIKTSLAAANLAVGPQYLIASKNYNAMVIKLAAMRADMEMEVSARTVLSSKLEAALKEQSVFRFQIDSSSSDEILQGLDMEGAIRLVDHLSDELDRKRYELTAERVALSPAATEEVVQAAQNEIRSIEVDSDRLESRIIDAQKQIESGIFKLRDLELEVSEYDASEDLSQLDDSRAQLTSAIVNDIETRSILNQKKSVEESALQLNKDSVFEDDKAISRIIVAWDDFGLAGQPMLDVAAAKQRALFDDIGDAESTLASIAYGEDELARWGWHIEAEKLQKELDSVRGENTESAYHLKLLSEIEYHAGKVNKVERVRAALEDFSTKLKSEIETVQEKIATVVPLWRALLNRIVREPRFGKTALTYISERNKSKARVHVHLGSHEVSVASVASEAQMTDIQLEFLLSMSLTHSWSPWKALLLDDPTQHHDLVHSASVFDLLRDFISDHGYQVVIATHDASQARFFLRKLLNDGIDARIINLQPSDEGVTVRGG